MLDVFGVPSDVVEGMDLESMTAAEVGAVVQEHLDGRVQEVVGSSGGTGRQMVVPVGEVQGALVQARLRFKRR